LSKKTKFKPSVLIDIERKKRVPSKRHRKAIAKALGTSPELLDFETDPVKSRETRMKEEGKLSSMSAAIHTIKTNYKRGDKGTIMCPECEGKLNFIVQEYDGHIWATCETEGCLSWMG